MKNARNVLAACLLLFVPLAQAARIAEPYVVEMPVASQGTRDRQAAEAAGLQLLLERLSGQRLDGHPGIAAAQGKAEQYLQRFSYRQEPVPSPAPVDGQPLVASQWFIRLVFLPDAVQSLMAQAGIVMWPLERPQVVLFIADQQARLLPASSETGDAAQRESLAALGQRRGLPLLVPDPAVQDITVSAAVQALDAEALLPSLPSLQADVLLLGSVHGNDQQGWSGQWLLADGEQQQPFTQKAADLTALVDGAVRQAVAILAGHYQSSAATDSGPLALRLQVDGVRSYPAFATLTRYLETLDAIRRIDATQIMGTTVILDVEVKGRESFRQLTGLSRSLQWQEEILPAPGSDTGARPVWRYQWRD